MAAKNPSPLRPCTPEWDAQVCEIMDRLPADRDGLLEAAMRARSDFNTAIEAGHDFGRVMASCVTEAVVWKLNGGTHHGCWPMRELVEAHCAAEPGAIPQWGQAGEYLMTVEGMRVRVVKSLGADVALHAVDPDSAFLSETGFRSCLGSLTNGRTVEEATAQVIRQVIGECGRKAIQPRYRDELKAAGKPAWLVAALAQATAAPVSGYVEKSGQLAFVF